MKRQRDQKFIIKLFKGNSNLGKEFHFTGLHVKLGIGLLLLWIASFGFLLYHFVNYNFSEYKLRRFAIENRYLKSRVEELSQKVATLDTLVNRYYKKYQALAEYVGVQAPPPELKEIGIGGHIEEPPYPDLQPVNDLEQKIAKLERFVNLQLSSFEKAAEKIEKDKRLRDHTPSIIPCNCRFTSGFGMRIDPFTGRPHFHKGIDLAGPEGELIYAPADGVVKDIIYDPRGYGKLLVIDHGYGITTRYGHLSAILVKKGQAVKRGQPIAKVGNTGRSTGPHLHYEVRVFGKAVNPLNYIIPDDKFYD